MFLNFFNEHQRGKAKRDRESYVVQVNRTAEALDASRAAIRGRKVTLPRRQPLIEEAGAKRYKCVRSGVGHLSLAFAHAWLAAADRPKRAAAALQHAVHLSALGVDCKPHNYRQCQGKAVIFSSSSSGRAQRQRM